jgi:hypothetical protein
MATRVICHVIGRYGVDWAPKSSNSEEMVESKVCKYLSKDTLEGKCKPIYVWEKEEKPRYNDE